MGVRYRSPRKVPFRAEVESTSAHSPTFRGGGRCNLRQLPVTEFEEVCHTDCTCIARVSAAVSRTTAQKGQLFIGHAGVCSMPQELLKQFDTGQFAVVGVNGNQTPAVALNAVAEHGIAPRSFQNAKEDGSSISAEWHIGGWPTFYLLDAEGVIARTWEGLPPQSEFRRHQPVGRESWVTGRDGFVANRPVLGTPLDVP